MYQNINMFYSVLSYAVLAFVLNVSETSAKNVPTVGPHCLVPGHRRSPQFEGDLLLREIDSKELQNKLLKSLNEKRVSERSITSCPPIFEWDSSLAQIAQQWADQCALVEYNNNSTGRIPSRLRHDHARSMSLEEKQGMRKFSKEPGVAQTIHWARTKQVGFGSKEVIDGLINSKLTTEEGLIDGVFARLGDEDKDGNVLSWGEATHVGCGWIQFPHIHNQNENSNAILEYDENVKETKEYENFMVCNYAIGVPKRTMCSKSAGDGLKIKSASVHKQFIKYYHASPGVIRDVKKCLQAVRCERRSKKLKELKLYKGRGGNKRCGTNVERCLAGKSGLAFVKPSKLPDVARSTDLEAFVDLEASKCKIDTILCSLNGTYVCKERLRRCLPLLDSMKYLASVGFVDQLDHQLSLNSSIPECECVDITLTDGTRGDCSQVDTEDPQQRKFCFVKRSPCVTINDFGVVEPSVPYKELNNMIHMSYQNCQEESLENQI